jgi:UDP-N-acetylglucosamine 3-dehydrogenase
MRSFLDAVSKRIPGPLVSAEDATNVTKVAEAAILSAQKGSPIYLNLR